MGYCANRMLKVLLNGVKVASLEIALLHEHCSIFKKGQRRKGTMMLQPIQRTFPGHQVQREPNTSNAIGCTYGQLTVSFVLTVWREKK